jgi:hypothetical protein
MYKSESVHGNYGWNRAAEGINYINLNCCYQFPALDSLIGSLAAQANPLLHALSKFPSSQIR